MEVKLISYSQEPVTDFSVDDAGIKSSALDLVAYCARVSNPENQANTTTNEKLVKYLIKHKHWSPLEMVSCCLEIDTTRDIARQILRHRSFSFQEFSQRYADPTKELKFEIREARLQDPNNRQNSIVTDDIELIEGWIWQQEQVISASTRAYNWAVKNGIAKEQARVVLPEGNTMSRMYVNGTLRSWLHYAELRSENGTQQEHIEIALAVSKVIAEIFPLKSAAQTV